jgi:hypothetical protein
VGGQGDNDWMPTSGFLERKLSHKILLEAELSLRKSFEEQALRPKKL